MRFYIYKCGWMMETGTKPPPLQLLLHAAHKYSGTWAWSRDRIRLGGGAGIGIDLERGVARSAKSSKILYVKIKALINPA